MRIVVLSWLLALGGLLACSTRAEAPKVAVADVKRGDLELLVSADGVVEPVRTVEVKSKSSGEVVSIDAETGDQVAEGQVLLQLSPKDARNVADQATADLESARSRLQNAEVSERRARRLHEDGLVPQSEVEAAELAVTSARTELVRTQKNLENASERLAETTVRSPIAGTIIGKHVEIGQVISSAVSQVSGGTLLFTLADLHKVHVRSLVDELDIGRLRPGQSATLRLEAFPDRNFEGTLVKIEPQAVVQQNVTMFPVLTLLPNPSGLLKPGMNAEVDVLVDRRTGVLTVPNEALKPPEDARAAAELLALAVEGGSKASEGGGERRARGKADASERAVLVSKGSGYEIRAVKLGLHTWDATEVVEGLSEGERVALLPSLAQLRQSTQFRDRIRQMRGMPGMGSGTRSGSKGS